MSCEPLDNNGALDEPHWKKRANKQTGELPPAVRHKRPAALFWGAGGFSFFPHECLYDCAVSLAVKFSGKTAHGRRTASKSLYSVSRRTAEVKSE